MAEESLETQVALLAQKVGTLSERLGDFTKEFADAPARLAKLEETAATVRWIGGLLVALVLGALVTFGMRVLTHYDMVEKGRAGIVETK